MKNLWKDRRPGDVEGALGAASAVGDDRLQKENQSYVVPDSFMHGTSAQRIRWFQKGLETGDVRRGDTFNAVICERREFESLTPGSTIHENLTSRKLVGKVCLKIWNDFA